MEERLFTELYILGFEEAVLDACGEGRVSLSGSALSLIDRVRQRLAALPAGERARAEEAKYLPGAGETVPASVTVYVTVDEGSTRYEEAFTYRREGRKWVLQSMGNE